MLFVAQSLIQNRYRLMHQLGRNGNRQTWLAKDEQTEKLVTLKALLFDLEMQWQDLKLFEREAVTLQSLKHPRIPQFVDSFWLDQQKEHQFCLVYSYIAGQSLGEIADAGRRWSLAEIKDLAKAILEILDYLHCLSPPVIHRDIKPSNVILGEDNHVYLIDFGSVQAQMGNGQTMTIVGTYGYMPPEQFYGQTTPASDLYSLGATLLTLTTGVEPSKWPREGTRILLQTLLQLDPTFRNWLEYLLEPETGKRLSAAKEALNLLLNPSILSPQKVVKKALGETLDSNKLAPILLSQATTKEVESTTVSRVKIFQDRDALQIVVPSLLSSDLAGSAFLLLLLLVVAFTLYVAQTLNLSATINALMPLIALVLVVAILVIMSILSFVFISKRFTSTKTRFILESSGGIWGSWQEVNSDEFESLAKLEYTAGKLSHTLWIVKSNGSREKLADHLTLCECQWIMEVFETWIQGKRQPV